jgi:hypothetical protein
MNKKSYLNEVHFVFVVQLFFWKILNFLTQTRVGRPRHTCLVDPRAWVWHACQAQRLVLDLSDLGLPSMLDPRCVSLVTMSDPIYLSMTNMSNLTNNKQREQLCTLVVTREKIKKKTQIIDHRRQSNHYLFTHATPYGRRHECASSETRDG